MKSDENYEYENDVISKWKSPLRWLILFLASFSLVNKNIILEIYKKTNS